MDSTSQFHDMADRLFGDLATPAVIEAAEAGTFPQALWSACAEAGIGQVLVADGHGGMGASLADAAAVLRAAGRHAAPGPLLEWMLGNALLAAAGQETSGTALALAITDHAGEGLPGALRDVVWPDASDEILLLAPGEEGGARMARIALSRFDRRPSIDAVGEPRAILQAHAGTQVPWTPLPDVDHAAFLQRAAVLRAAQMVGALQWCLERTCAYTLERKQFGREISRFQAVQQMVAEMASATVAASAMTDAAISCGGAALATAAARSRLGDAVDTACAIAHQVHGAIGFSYEYALHFRTRRLMAWRDDFGSVTYWRRVLASALLGHGPDAVWPLLCEAAAPA